ncbi:integrin alpha-8-like [Cyprinus carpio]|uniref:Integrin alpha-8-like n=1 Tax=Cyprinus carpio TaxID=7962 RepID=A0A9R0AS36_CYPCA|nr:integrin alpha-8-like [Cyprinus carpio]
MVLTEWQSDTRGTRSYYFQGQIITASLTNIMSSGSTFSPIHSVRDETKTPERFDYYDLYLGYSVAAGHFNKDSITDYVVGVPNDLHTAGSVKIINGATEPLQIMKAISGIQVI